MSIATTYSAQLVGLKIHVVTIEVDISQGLHSFSVVGLGDRAVEESKDRISAAIKNSCFISPKQKNQKVIISLAPADLRKEGPSFDLAMALAYLKAAGDVNFEHSGKLFFGELALDGTVRKVPGILPLLCQAVAYGYTQAYIPKENAQEASLARGIEVYAISSLQELIEHVSGTTPIPAITQHQYLSSTYNSPRNMYDMRNIRGNEAAKRGLEIAAAGAHNLIMCGPPGTGKTMLAQSFCSLLPALSYDHSVEVTGIHSAAHTLKEELIAYPPFRSPHHTASYPAIIGGGSIPRPGEVTLAHRGVLFLDEFPEFDRDVIEALRQPLEENMVTISRARGSVTFPAQCILIASMNPCPCGRGKQYGCICPEKTLNAYRRRLSGPIIDRIDVWVNVNSVDYDKLAAQTSSSESSSEIQHRVAAARNRQIERFKRHNVPISFNSEMNAKTIEMCVNMTQGARTLLKQAAEKQGISGRAFHRTIKVAQTIADLSGHEEIQREAMLEALQYRDRSSAA